MNSRSHAKHGRLTLRHHQTSSSRLLVTVTVQRGGSLCPPSWPSSAALHPTSPGPRSTEPPLPFLHSHRFCERQAPGPQLRYLEVAKDPFSSPSMKMTRMEQSWGDSELRARRRVCYTFLRPLRSVLGWDQTRAERFRKEVGCQREKARKSLKGKRKTAVVRFCAVGVAPPSLSPSL